VFTIDTSEESSPGKRKRIWSVDKNEAKSFHRCEGGDREQQDSGEGGKMKSHP